MSLRGPYTTPVPDQPTTLGERIRAVRMAWHWTQAELGAALNTDQTTVSSWERERVTPSGPTLAALAQLFRTTPEALLGQEDWAVPEVPGALPVSPKPGLRSVHLPDTGSAVAHYCDLTSEQDIALHDSQEAMLRLIQATREGRKVWVVVE